MAGVITRVAIEQDAETAVSVIQRSIEDLCAADHHGDPESLAQWLANKTPANFLAWMARSGQYTIVAELDGRLCGVGMLGPGGEIRLCYVHPHYTRRGVGRALVYAIESHAREVGLGRLRLDATNSAARFYEAMGFERTGDTRYEKRLGLAVE